MIYTLNGPELTSYFIENTLQPYQEWIEACGEKLIQFEELLFIRKGDQDPVLRTTQGLFAANKEGVVVFTRYWDGNSDRQKSLQSRTTYEDVPSIDGGVITVPITTRSEVESSRLVSCIINKNGCYIRQFEKSGWELTQVPEAVRKTHLQDYRLLSVSLANSLVLHSGQSFPSNSILKSKPTSASLYDNGDVRLVWESKDPSTRREVLFSASSRMFPVSASVSIREKSAATDDTRAWKEFARTLTSWDVSSDKTALLDVNLRYVSPLSKPGKGIFVQGNVFFEKIEKVARPVLFDPSVNNFPIPQLLRE